MRRREFKARAISFVLAGGIVTAILGPQIVIFTRELLAPVMFAGSFVAILPLAAVGAIILSFLRIAGRDRRTRTSRRSAPGRCRDRHPAALRRRRCSAPSAPMR